MPLAATICYAPTDAYVFNRPKRSLINTTCNRYIWFVYIHIKLSDCFDFISIIGMRCRTLGVLTVVCAQLRQHIWRGNVSGNINRGTGGGCVCVCVCTNEYRWFWEINIKIVNVTNIHAFHLANIYVKIVVSLYCNYNCYCYSINSLWRFIHSIVMNENNLHESRRVLFMVQMMDTFSEKR